MTRTKAQFYEYESISKEAFVKKGFNEEDWHELLDYVNFLAYFCRRKDYDVEETPRNSYDQEVNLGGFVGYYELGSGNEMIIRCRPDKLRDEEFAAMVRGVVEWAGMIGPPFLKVLLNTCSPVSFEHEISLAYSSLLIACTENANTEYVPPIVENRRHVSPIPLGHILIPQTISSYSKGRLSIVSRRVRVNIETPLRLFMLRFHVEMVKALKWLELEVRSSYEERPEEDPLRTQPLRVLSRNLGYHVSFILNDLNGSMLDEAIETDFTTSQVLEELWKQASTSPSIRDMIFLWEAFIGKRVLTSKISEVLQSGVMLKPLSKLYELWCLKSVLEVLKDFFGNYKPPDELPGYFNFENEWKGWKVSVLYNGSPPGSRIIKRLREAGVGVSAGKKPDLTITFSGQGTAKKITLVADVKYKLRHNINDEDIGRFMWYMMDYVEHPDKRRLEGILLHLPTGSGETHDRVPSADGKLEFHLFGLKPYHEKESKLSLGKLFKEILEQ